MNKDKYKVISLDDNITSKIYRIRNLQVMLDSDLANLYNVDVKVFNQAVKRNITRFPKEFRFQLTKEDYNNLRSQIVTSRFRLNLHGGRRYLPYTFTEQGVAMLSGILNSNKAIEINIQIMRAFISMKRFISSNISISNRLEHIEHKTIEYDANFKKIFDVIDSKENKLKDQGIFFNGEIFDSYKFVVDLLKTAKTSIILIDNYIDESILTLFTKINKNIKIKIYTNVNNKVKLDINKYNSQYNNIELVDFKESHDRFLIIDNKKIYHIGSSLKDLGKKWFAFSKIDLDINIILNKLNIF
jgi:hypothetical protein